MLSLVKSFSSVLKMAEKLCQQSRLVQPDTGAPVSLLELKKSVCGNKKIIYFGETHEQKEIIQMQLAVLECLVEKVEDKKSGRVSLIMEHFNLAQQPILDAYMRGELSSAQLQARYDEEGEEGHDLGCYEPLLRYARQQQQRVELVAGFLPRGLARVLVKEGEEAAYGQAQARGYLHPQDIQSGSESHYNFFESLISGRCLRTNFHGGGDTFRQIFPAQIIKDCTMAATIRKKLTAGTGDDLLLVIAGSGHIDYRFGVPERVDRYGLVPIDQTCIITVRPEEDSGFLEAQPYEHIGEFDHPFPGDFIFLYGEESAPEGEEGAEDHQLLLKGEISAAYEKVASSAHMQGNIRLAHKVMTRLGYNEHQIQVAGVDAYNYQGVGCPHKAAALQTGERVLDVGSGLGVDSFIAAEAVGPTGAVLGLDLSLGEVKHATARAQARGCGNVRFVQGDMERMPLEDTTFDAVISNGAFCLAPNKEKAFR